MLATVKPARRAATYDDVLAAPEHLVAEILDGDLYTSPRPAFRHGHSASAIGGALFGDFGGPAGAGGRSGGWRIFFEPEIHLGSDVLVPDLAGWRRERMPLTPDAPFTELAPDWVCEVASPSTVALDRGHKMKVYAREGVGHLWLVDPLVRTLEVYRLEPAARAWLLVDTHAGTAPVRAVPFDAIELDLARWWIETG